MKFILPLSGVLLFLSCARVLAQETGDQYVRVYNDIQQADAYMERGEDRAALDLYRTAQSTLRKIKSDNPTWKSNIVDFRLKYLKEKIEPLELKYPPPPTSTETTTVVAQPMSGLEEQLHKMNDELIHLRTDRARLEGKLKEALSASPGQVDPATLEEARQQIAELNKKIDLQNAILDTNRGTVSSGSSEASKQLKAERERNEKLEKDIKKYEALLTDPGTKLPGDLQKENEALKKKYQEALRQLFEKKKELIQ
jgi:hypothetical protein